MSYEGKAVGGSRVMQLERAEALTLCNLKDSETPFGDSVLAAVVPQESQATNRFPMVLSITVFPS